MGTYKGRLGLYSIFIAFWRVFENFWGYFDYIGIITILSDNKNDWIQRKEWLRRIQVYCDCDPTTLEQYLVNLYEPLNSQIQDLRSSIIKESCTTIVKICKTYSGNFENEANDPLTSLVNKLMDKECLIKQLNSGNKTVSVSCPLSSCIVNDKWMHQENIKQYYGY